MVSETPTDGRCNYEYDDGGYCEAHPMDNGRCFHHGGQRENGGAPEGNTNAVDHAAWSESFVTDFLRDDEIARVRQAEDLLGTPETAQELSRTVAAVVLEQARRSGDERFYRRYESICDTFGIAPEGPPDTEVDVTVETDGLTTEQKEQLDALLDRDVQE